MSPEKRKEEKKSLGRQSGRSPTGRGAVVVIGWISLRHLVFTCEVRKWRLADEADGARGNEGIFAPLTCQPQLVASRMARAGGGSVRLSHAPSCVRLSTVNRAGAVGQYQTSEFRRHPHPGQANRGLHGPVCSFSLHREGWTARAAAQMPACNIPGQPNREAELSIGTRGKGC